jgi:arylsulfatase
MCDHRRAHIAAGDVHLLALLLALVLGCGCAAEEGRAPDVLLITIDTLRADHLGTYGFAADTSPRIDRLAQSGVVFERAIAAAGKTVPSHATIMTSRYTREHSVGNENGTTLLRGAVTLAQRFKESGYATGAFASNLLLTAFTGFDAGFDEYDCGVDTPERNRSHVLERVAEQTTKRAIEWLSSVGRTPVFLWVHYQDPHGPYTPPPDIEDRFRVPPPSDERPLPWSRIPKYQRLPELRRVSEYRSRYAAEIFYADEWVGKLLAAVHERRPEVESIVLLTADHGESFGETPHYFSHTHSSAPNVAHVPMIIRAPGIRPGRIPEIVHHVDVMPTLLELAGLPVPSESSGVALGPVLRGSESLPDRYVYCDNGRELSAYRGHEFIRIRGALGAWNEAETPSLRPELDSLHWAQYTWSDASHWSPSPSPRSSERLPDAVSAYVGSAVAKAKRKPLSDKQREQLKSLGYLNDD